MPGMYQLGAPLQMRSFIDVEGSGEQVTLLVGGGESVVLGAGGSEIRFLKIYATGTYGLFNQSGATNNRSDIGTGQSASEPAGSRRGGCPTR